MLDDKKSLERCVLDAFLQNCRDLKKYKICEGERPDFILLNDGYQIGIEHFRADTILNEHADSNSMKFDGKRKAMFKKHNTALMNDKFDAISAANDIEANINTSLNAASGFDYGAFVKNLKNVFDAHADKVSDYKKKCNEVWFLIDVGIETEHFLGVLDNGGQTRMNTLPVTKDMMNVFNEHRTINRVIVCSRYLRQYKVVYDSCGKKYKYRFRSFTYVEAATPVTRQIKLNVKERRRED